MNQNKEQGYVTIVTSIVISLVVLLVATVIGNRSILGQSDTQAMNLKEASREAALGCLEYARLELAQGPYGAAETVTFASSTCEVLSVQSSNGEKIIRSKANNQNNTTILEMAVESDTLKKVYLKELSSSQ